jgi:hypothetical protein
VQDDFQKREMYKNPLGSIKEKIFWLNTQEDSNDLIPIIGISPITNVGYFPIN